VGAGEAQAKLIVINTGEEIYEVADFDEQNFVEIYGEVPPGDWKLGYMCSHFGIFWADVWTWDCELVAFEGETYADLPPDMRLELKQIHPWSNAQRGAWNKYGFWTLGGLLVVGVVIGKRDGDSD
jgi:hypothetical protein